MPSLKCRTSGGWYTHIHTQHTRHGQRPHIGYSPQVKLRSYDVTCTAVVVFQDLPEVEQRIFCWSRSIYTASICMMLAIPLCSEHGIITIDLYCCRCDQSAKPSHASPDNVQEVLGSCGQAHEGLSLNYLTHLRQIRQLILLLYLILQCPENMNIVSAAGATTYYRYRRMSAGPTNSRRGGLESCRRDQGGREEC